jgi:hypothetical protein
MSDPDNYSQDSELHELRQELQKVTRGFSTQLMAVVICLVVFNFSVNLFIYKQLSIVSRQASEMADTLSKYETGSATQMNKFMEELIAYSRTNKDFYDTVFKQYLSASATNSPAPAAPNAGAPKPSAPKK